MAFLEAGNQGAPDSQIPYPVQEEGMRLDTEESMPSSYSYEQVVAHPESAQEEEGPRLDYLDGGESIPSSYEKDNIAHPESEVHKMAGIAEERPPDLEGEEKKRIFYDRACAVNNISL
jgi:hypothetical protein